jgi:tetratricopeptide (TPR) repeat protein
MADQGSQEQHELEKQRQTKEGIGDRISLGNIYDRAAVAVGRGARAEIRVFNIDIRLLPLVLLLTGVVIVLSFLLLYHPAPEKMSGRVFNVAVAKFTHVDEEGLAVKSDDGLRLAETLHDRLQTNFSELGRDLGFHEGDIDIWPPEYTGTIKGQTADERESAARDLADVIGADLIIYGVIQDTGSASQFTPEFYVDFKGSNEAAEITGRHQLGEALRLQLPFDSVAFLEVENPALSARTKALALITIGLAFYVNDDFQTALEYFSQARDTRGWLDNAGKQVAYLLLGNTYTRLAATEKSTAYLPEAMANYDEAREIDPGYVRAGLGRAVVLYLTALGDPADANFEGIDLEILAEAENIFQETLEMEDLPANANLETKSRFYLGLIYFVLSQIDDDAELSQAKAYFERITSDFEAGSEDIALQAGYAYGQLALIARLEGNPSLAIQNYEQAIDLVTPREQANYYTELGEVYCHDHQKDQAVEAYREAIRITEFYGEQESARRYSEALHALEAGDC